MKKAGFAVMITGLFCAVGGVWMAMFAMIFLGDNVTIQAISLLVAVAGVPIGWVGGAIADAYSKIGEQTHSVHSHPNE